MSGLVDCIGFKKIHAHARPRAPGTAHLRCGLGDSDRVTRLESLRSLRSSLGPRTEHALGHLHEPGEGSRARRRDAQRPQLPRRVPAKTDRTSSWQFGRLPGALRAPGSLSARGEPRVEVEAHRGPPPVRGPDRLRANPAQLLEALERALHETQGSVRLVHSWRYTPRAR